MRVECGSFRGDSFFIMDDDEKVTAVVKTLNGEKKTKINSWDAAQHWVIETIRTTRNNNEVEGDYRE